MADLTLHAGAAREARAASRAAWLLAAPALLLFVGLIYFWLFSPIHFIAMLDWRLYRVMNWSMVIDGLMFWWLVLDPRPAPPARLAPGRRVLLVIAAIPPQILLGAYIFFTPHELYPIYSICGRAFTWLSAMRDQQIGGLLLWIPGSMMSLVGALIALRHWMRLSARGRLRSDRPRRGAGTPAPAPSSATQPGAQHGS